jgi:hypothetical protein
MEGGGPRSYFNCDLCLRITKMELRKQLVPWALSGCPQIAFEDFRHFLLNKFCSFIPDMGRSLRAPL